MRIVPVILVVPLVLACAACRGSGTDESGSSPSSLAKQYVRAINERDGERVCRLLTRDAAGELFPADTGIPCARAVAGLIGYVEDTGSTEFLSYDHFDAKPGSELPGYTSVRLALEARFHNNSEGGYFEVCRFDDTLWLTQEDDGWRIAKPSVTLYAAFGADRFPAESLAPPGLGASGVDESDLSRRDLFACRRDAGAEAAPSAGRKWTATSLADYLGGDERHFVDVRCIDAAGHGGWDFVCTYTDPRSRKRMKAAYAVAADEMGLLGSGSVPEGSWLPARS